MTRPRQRASQERQTVDPGATCLGLFKQGFYVRSFECPAFQPKPSVFVYNLSEQRKLLGETNFSRAFAACADGQFRQTAGFRHIMNALPESIKRASRSGVIRATLRRYMPTSFWRHDLPLSSYAGRFGLMIDGALTPRCSYPFDAFTINDRDACRVQHYVDTYAERRLHTANRACSNPTTRGPSPEWRAQTSQVIEHACCLRNKSLAIRYQKEHEQLARNASHCVLGNGVNQMSLTWQPLHVLGVFYTQPEDAPHARTLWSVLHSIDHQERVLCQFPRRRYLQDESCGARCSATVRQYYRVQRGGGQGRRPVI
eukprot:CAMPEP_0183357094 /NCGR_PEP_ID=MMETSP0164_2-20130417/45373_1 /TAXON_ID=221442 /ORGANISM="Coccolithus pelagicus ssp braarudi, Strain PLY182g" /LENGTH=312 /DNA_ID=CAMNT_0025530647 /DNA_START=66 /DNA_END=1004 /DNA_ORIENTATION=-